MIFLRPDFLYGLFALAIPVIIHLFNFRRHKKIYFSDISRLKNITTHTRKQQKLKHIVVLLLRLIAVALIVLALAGPEIKKNNKSNISESNTAAIYVDNSYSMLAEGRNGRLFESARKDALQLVKNSPTNTSFILLSNSSSGQLNRVLNKKVTISELEKLNISTDSKKLSQIISSRDRILKNSKLSSSKTYLFSDFQANSSNIDNLPEDSTSNYIFIPYHHLQNKNIYIDSCSFTSPYVMKNSSIGLTVWIKNDSETDYKKVPLKLTINNQQKAVAGIDIKAGSTKQIVVNFTISEPGWQLGVVEIEDFPITFDDKLFFSFEVKRTTDILIIGSNTNNEYLKLFYESDDIFSVSEMNYKNIDFEVFKEYNLIIFNSIPNISSGLVSKVKQFISDGGNLLFIPSDSKNLKSNSFFLDEINAGNIVSYDTVTTRVTRLKLSNNLFSESINKVPRNANLPTVKSHFKYSFPISSKVETLVSLLSGDDFLSKKSIGSGQLYILSTGLDKSYGNFSSHLLFVPIMHGIASKSGAKHFLYYTLGEDDNINLSINESNISESPLQLVSTSTKHSLIPGQKLINGKLNLSLSNLTLQGGFYNVVSADSIITVLAFNHNRLESDMSFYNVDEINELCNKSKLTNYQIINASDSDYKEIINALQKESDFWKLFIIFALLVIFAEILVLRFWK